MTMTRRAVTTVRSTTLGVVLSIGLAGCGGTVTEPEDLTLFVGPEQVGCQGEAQQLCLLVKWDPAEDWELFYDEIQGFDFEPGFIYELRVRRYRVPDPPAGGSAYRWELLEVVSKTPA